MAMLDKGASGRLHLMWSGRVEATGRAHLEINHEIDAAARAALEREMNDLGSVRARLATSTAAYREFLEHAFVAVRAKQRVADYLVDQAQTRTHAQVKTVKGDVDGVLPGGAASLLSGKPLSKILAAGRQATIKFALTTAAKLRALPDRPVFVFKTTAAEGLEKGAELLTQWLRHETEDVEAQRLPLRSAVERDVAALRELLAQMNGRLRSHFSQAFINSLYPELARNNTRLAEPDDEDETPAESDAMTAGTAPTEA